MSNYYIQYASTDAEIEQLTKWLMREDLNLSDHYLTDDNFRWNIVKKAYSSTSLSESEKQLIFLEVELTDFTDRSKRTKTICSTIIASS